MSNPTGQQQLNVTTPAERQIRVERIFNASRERVWRAFTEPDLLAQWWGRGNRLEVVRFELEAGGHWRFVEHHDGGVDGFEGRFREVVPQERLSQTFEWDGMPGHVSVDTAEFADMGDGRTKVTTTTMFFTDEERDGMADSGMAEGMAESYAALDRLLAKTW